MKNKVLKGLLGVICICGLYYANKSTQTVAINLALENIEALASGEGSGDYRCYGYGDIDCHGFKVRDRIDDWSLNLE